MAKATVLEITCGGRKGRPAHSFKFNVPTDAWEALGVGLQYALTYGLRQTIQDAAADDKEPAAIKASMEERAACIARGERPSGREGDPTRRYVVEIAIGAGVLTAKQVKGLGLDAVLALVAKERDQATADKVRVAAERMRDLKRIEL